jgi:uncharacterized glyoxalase superfamily protein PhnB
VPVYPALRYRDARAAIDFLVEAFGFEVKETHEGPGGVIGHAELRAGDGLVMLGSEPAEPDVRFGEHAGAGWTYVSVADPDTLHERAVTAGAKIVRPLENTDYGSREFSARDLEDNIWSFGTYAPAP